MLTNDDALINQKESNRTFFQSEWLYLHQYVLDYQNGSEEAAGNIVECFEEFIYKYLHFICHKIYSPNNYSIQRFVVLFMTVPKFRKLIKKAEQCPKVRAHVYETVDKIHFLYSRLDSEDVYQILVLTLLQMAKKYKDYSRPSFHSYVQKCFHYECFRNLNRIINDPADRRLNNDHYFDDKFRLDDRTIDTFTVIRYERVMNEVAHKQLLLKSNDLVIQEVDVSVYDNSLFNLNWINGITCHDVFRALTPFERNILVLSYIYKQTDKEIAEHYGLCRATINRKKKAAIEKIKSVPFELN